jgi:hypothetical protein
MGGMRKGREEVKASVHWDFNPALVAYGSQV